VIFPIRIPENICIIKYGNIFIIPIIPNAEKNNALNPLKCNTTFPARVIEKNVIKRIEQKFHFLLLLNIIYNMIILTINIEENIQMILKY
jgi:hypothetical protein